MHILRDKYLEKKTKYCIIFKIIIAIIIYDIVI